jgi:hypothetical protein
VLVRGLGEFPFVLELLIGGEKMRQAPGLAVAGLANVARYDALLDFERMDAGLYHPDCRSIIAHIALQGG